MIAPGESAPEPYDDAMMAIRLLAHDPVGLGGIVLRGGGEMRDALIDELRGILPEGAPVRRLPTNIDDERLLGGLDLGATLAAGNAVRQAGLLAEADGGIVVIPMAERLAEGVAARIAGAIDAEESQFAVVALDDGLGEDEAVPAALAERLAFRVDVDSLPSNFLPRRRPGPSCAGGLDSAPREARSSSKLGPGLRRVRGLVSEEVVNAIAATASALGVDSARASLFALRAARASAALAARDHIAEQDVVLAVRLVLAPRATRLPATDHAPAEDEAPPPPENDGGKEKRGEPEPLEDIVLEAALAALPKDVLARIAAGRGRRATRAKGAGEKRRSQQRGRPLGARAGLPRGGLRLSLIDTLRAAAPWQKLRGSDGTRVRIRRDDLRIRRFETRAEAVTIFAVDASGSSAMARLAEAKGAVELLLAEAYVKRAQVALVAFRGTAAETLLPPTRSLARAKRSLAELPGGGGTPLAAGLNAARELAESEKARGRTPFVVILTDGRANIAADGSMVRRAAEDDAEAAARAIGVAGIAAAFVDTSARPRPEGARLALAMGARYLPLPRADAAAMHAAVSAAQSK